MPTMSLEYQRQYRLTHKKQIAEYHRKAYREGRWGYHNKYNKEFREKLKFEVLGYYSKNGEPECVRCGIVDIDVLTIDHINGRGKAHRGIVGTGNAFYFWLRRNNYPDGYQTLCFNCNMKKRIRGGEIKYGKV